MIFVDANILLEILLLRPKYQKALDVLGTEKTICISFLSVHLFYHFGLKNGDTLETLDKVLENLKILNCNQEVYNLAKTIRQSKDFEDALQIATAIYNEVEIFYTLDEKLAKNYKNLLKVVRI